MMKYRQELTDWNFQMTQIIVFLYLAILKLYFNLKYAIFEWRFPQFCFKIFYNFVSSYCCCTISLYYRNQKSYITMVTAFVHQRTTNQLLFYTVLLYALLCTITLYAMQLQHWVLCNTIIAIAIILQLLYATL